MFFLPTHLAYSCFRLPGWTNSRPIRLDGIPSTIVFLRNAMCLEHIKNCFYFACTYCVHLSDPQTSPVCDIERLGCSVIVHENQITTRFFPLANMLCAYAINRWEKTFSAAHSMALELG